MGRRFYSLTSGVPAARQINGGVLVFRQTMLISFPPPKSALLNLTEKKTPISILLTAAFGED